MILSKKKYLKQRLLLKTILLLIALSLLQFSSVYASEQLSGTPEDLIKNLNSQQTISTQQSIPLNLTQENYQNLLIEYQTKLNQLTNQILLLENQIQNSKTINEEQKKLLQVLKNQSQQLISQLETCKMEYFKVKQQLEILTNLLPILKNYTSSNKNLLIEQAQLLEIQKTQLNEVKKELEVSTIKLEKLKNDTKILEDQFTEYRKQVRRMERRHKWQKIEWTIIGTSIGYLIGRGS